MRKRRPSLSDEQLAFTFAAPRAARLEGDLAGISKQIASGCARALKEDRRSRDEIAGNVSALLSETVSRFMLDAYASEARDEHNISAARFFALIAATDRYDILDVIVSRIGARVLVGEEVNAARYGHLMAAKQEIEEQLRAIRPLVSKIGEGRAR